MKNHGSAILTLSAAALFAFGCGDRRLGQGDGGQAGTGSGAGGTGGASSVAFGGANGAGGSDGPGIGGSGVGGSGVGGSGFGGSGVGGSGVGGSGSGGRGVGGIFGGLGWTRGVPDAAGCCAPDPTMTGCMVIGGYSPEGCYVWCDFFCSTNWHLEPDAHGCPVWRWSIRSPAPGETSLCFPGLDAMPDRADTRDAEAESSPPADADD